MERDEGAIFDLSDAIWNTKMQLTPTEVLILVNIASNCGGDMSRIPASLGGIIRQTQLAKSTVDRVMRQMYRKGVLERTVEYESHSPAHYHIHIDKLDI
ncbi:MAG: MarR family winged helix-turn-helix transcriptional regulator [Pseudomonadota bacterium]